MQTGVKSAVKKLLIYQSPLFESLANKLEQYPELRQLAEYPEYYHIDKGYMLSFNFNKNKQAVTHTIQLGEKTIFEVVV